MRFDVKSAVIVNESVSESPIVILTPVKSKSPPKTELPMISNLPNEPVEVAEPLMSPDN